MKKFLVSLLLIITCLALVGCGTKEKEKKDNKEETDDITMTIKDGTLTRSSATIVIKETGSNRYDYGQPFSIDKKVNGKWEELKMADVGFNSPAYHTDKNRELELKHNWLAMYGELEDGEYRLVKDVCINDGCTKKKEFYVEFTIGDEKVVINETVKKKIIDTTKIEVCTESIEENKEDTILKTITDEKEVNRIVDLLYHVKKDTRTYVAGVGTGNYLVLYNSKNQQLSKIYIGSNYITVDEKDYLRDTTSLLSLFYE